MHNPREKWQLCCLWWDTFFNSVRHRHAVMKAKRKKNLQVCSYDRVLILSNSLVSSKHKDHRAPFRGTISCMRGTLLQNSAPSEVQLAVDAAGRRWIERWIKPKSFQIVSDLDGSKFWHLRDVFYICIKNIDYLKAYKQSRVHSTKTVSCTTRS